MAKNIYIGVDNVARKVKQPFIGVDNVARKVKGGFIGVDNVARQFFQGGTPVSDLGVGSSVYLNENGSPVEYIIVNKGIPQNSSLYDSSCDGIWLLRKYIPSEPIQWSSGNAKLENSSIHSWLNSTMLSKYDASVQSMIKQVKIPYKSEGDSFRVGEIKSGANGLPCKVFMLSAREVGAIDDDDNSYYDDGVKLPFFLSGNDYQAQEVRKTTSPSTSVSAWWLRTPFRNYSAMGRVIGVGGIGTYSYMSTTQSYVSVRPAIIMPSNTVCDPSTFLIS